MYGDLELGCMVIGSGLLSAWLFDDNSEYRGEFFSMWSLWWALFRMAVEIESLSVLLITAHLILITFSPESIVYCLLLMLSLCFMPTGPFI